MKKVLLITSVLALAACQAPYNHDVYQAAGPTVCVEYFDSFRCSAPQRIWNETVYPKNNHQMGYGPSTYVPYQGYSLSQTVYGTY